MTPSQPSQNQLTGLADYLAKQREAVLEAWAASAAADPKLATGSGLSRDQFRDHIPAVLDAYEASLRALADPDVAGDEAGDDAASHGRQRWQQGYHLREVAREWGHLHVVLLDEVERYISARPDLDAATMLLARRALARLCADGVGESAAAYFELRRAEAAGNVRDLEAALTGLREAERKTGEVWREAAHDLRGNLSAVRNATFVLGREGLPEGARAKSVNLLQRSVTSLLTLMEEVLDLSRLQAGQDPRRLLEFDAAVELTELTSCFQPLAQERGLTLMTEGPETFPVEGDPVKVRRIAQNLLLNALKYTEKGSVTVTWGDSRTNDLRRWMLCVADTGPGLCASSAGPLSQAMERATEVAQQVDPAASERQPVPAAVSSSQTDRMRMETSHGEGIGLSIVKRLCELLEAAIEVESVAGNGTTFRVILPRAYEKAPVQ